MIADHESDKENVGRALNDIRFVRRRWNLRPEADERRLNQQRKRSIFTALCVSIDCPCLSDVVLRC